MKARIKGFILAYGRIADNDNEVRRQLEVLKGMSSGFGPFNDSSNKQLIPIREIELAKDALKIENDKKMKSNDKKNKLAEIKKSQNELKQFSDLMEKF